MSLVVVNWTVNEWGEGGRRSRGEVYVYVEGGRGRERGRERGGGERDGEDQKNITSAEFLCVLSRYRKDIYNISLSCALFK